MRVNRTHKSGAVFATLNPLHFGGPVTLNVRQLHLQDTFFNAGSG